MSESTPIWNKKYADLLEDENVRRWHRNLANGSVLYAIISLKSLGRFLQSDKHDPKRMRNSSFRKDGRYRPRYGNHLQASENPSSGEPFAPGYVENKLDTLRNWAIWNRNKFLRNTKIPYAGWTPSLDNEIILFSDQLRRVLAHTTEPRVRVSIAIMAFSGCRPHVQDNFLGRQSID